MRVLRAVLVLAASAMATVVGLLLVRNHIVLEPGVRVTIETRSATNAVCHVAWTTSERRAFTPIQARDVSIPAGEGDVCVDLPVSSCLTGLRVTAPGVVLGRVTVVGNRRLLRCDTAADIPEKLDLPAMRLPHWKSGGK